MPDVPNSPAKRLIVGGVLVVGVSVAASMLFTHLSFVEFGDLKYEGAMWAAAIVPLLVAPTDYGWVALLSWRLHKANAALDTLARRDALTGLHNRRAFVEAARARLAAGARVLLLIADIDHFKRINDSLGHSAGDQVIRAVATQARDCLRPYDQAFRFGGEEFVVILSQTSLAKGMQIAERIRKRIAQRCSLDAATTGKITVSIGAAEIREAETVDGLFDRADRALYRAKSEGRNRSIAAD